MGRHSLILQAPRLPLESPNQPWLVLLEHHGPSTDTFMMHAYYYTCPRFSDAHLIQVVLLAADWRANILDPFFQAFYGLDQVCSTVSVWMWDGSNLHSGSYGTFTTGQLSTPDVDFTRCVLVQRFAAGVTRNINGRWWSGVVNSAWVDATTNDLRDVNTSGIKPTLATILFHNYTYGGITWSPAICHKTLAGNLQLAQVNRLRYVPKLVTLRRRQKYEREGLRYFSQWEVPQNVPFPLG